MKNSDALIYLDRNCTSTKFYALHPKEPIDILSSEHKTVVTIEWRYDDVVPSQELMLLFKILDNALESMTESESHIMVHSTLGDGMRELCFYTTDYDQFMETLNASLSSLPALPIGIEFDQDRKWKYATSIRKLAKKGELRQQKLAA